MGARTDPQATQTIAALEARIAEMEKEAEDGCKYFFMWRKPGMVPTIKGGFSKISQAVKFAEELIEINQTTKVSVLNIWRPGSLGGESLENFLNIYGDRRTKAVRQLNGRSEINQNIDNNA